MPEGETISVAGGPRVRSAVRAMLPKLRAIKGIGPGAVSRSADID